MPHPRSTRSFLRRRWPWIAGATVLALLIAGPALRSPPPPQLLTAEVGRGPIERTVIATGTVEAKRLVSVGAQVSGQVQALKVVLGDRVRAGQVIAEIDSTTQRNALRNAEAARANVRAQRSAQRATLAQAEAAYRRQQAMMRSEATSRADLDAARASYEAARAQLEALDAQIAQAATSLDTARANLGYTRVIAPGDGVVVAVAVEEGQTVNAVQSSPTIVKIAALDVVTVEAEISEADVIHVAPGQSAYFTILADPDRRFPGRLRAIAPAPESLAEDTGRGDSGGGGDAEAVYYNGLFDVPNTDGTLRIGMTARVHIVLERIENALRVPLAALGERGADGRYVVRALGADGAPTVRRVRIGVRNQIDAQVLDGLRAGERVVVGEAVETPASASFLPPRPDARGGN